MDATLTGEDIRSRLHSQLVQMRSACITFNDAETAFGTNPNTGISEWVKHHRFTARFDAGAQMFFFQFPQPQEVLFPGVEEYPG
jgi:hypothetical protein